ALLPRDAPKGLVLLPSSSRLATAAMSRYSYSSTTVGLGNRLNELRQLMRATRRSPESGADWVMRLYNDTRARISELSGVPVENLQGLDIGPGQQLGCLKCFSLTNAMVAIDTDI